jgi:hypothetical protein
VSGGSVMIGGHVGRIVTVKVGECVGCGGCTSSPIDLLTLNVSTMPRTISIAHEQLALLALPLLILLAPALSRDLHMLAQFLGRLPMMRGIRLELRIVHIDLGFDDFHLSLPCQPKWREPVVSLLHRKSKIKSRQSKIA